jgi:hypothetical protein
MERQRNKEGEEVSKISLAEAVCCVLRVALSCSQAKGCCICLIFPQSF